MSVAWLCPNCPSAQQRVFILCWPLARDTHSDSSPLVQSSKQCRAAVLLQRASVGQSPGGGVFSDKCVPNLAPHSIASLSSPPCECQCGWAVAPWIPCLQIPCIAFYLHCLPPLQPQPQPLCLPTIVFLLNETSSLMKHEIQAFILALAGIQTSDLIQAVLIKSPKMM